MATYSTECNRPRDHKKMGPQQSNLEGFLEEVIPELNAEG
jgi:hypothetical protein